MCGVVWCGVVWCGVVWCVCVCVIGSQCTSIGLHYLLLTLVYFAPDRNSNFRCWQRILELISYIMTDDLICERMRFASTVSRLTGC